MAPVHTLGLPCPRQANKSMMMECALFADSQYASKVKQERVVVCVGGGCLQTLMNSKRSANLYDLSKQLQEKEEKNYQIQAKKIANAYREVQQLKVNKPKTGNPKEQPSRHKPQSTYAIKVKETLSQLKSQQNKEMQQLTKFKVQPSSKVQSQQQEYTKLQKAAVVKIISTIEGHQQQAKEVAMKTIVRVAQEDEKKEYYFILKFKKFKIFRAWKEEFILSKLEKERKEKSDHHQMAQAQQMSKQFRAFSLLKRSFTGWKQYIKKQLKRKAYQHQLRRMQLQKMMKEEEKHEKKENPVKKNEELQNKLRGFLDGLKGKIQDKDRLRTIKENTEQSDMNIKVRSETVNEDEDRDEGRQEEQEYNIDSEEDDRNEVPSNQNQVIIQPPQGQPSYEKKAMTNDQLEKRRNQLQGKHKKRKQALQRLKRQKQDKKREDQLQRAQIQRQVEIQQKKVKQQKYRQFLKNKQEQQEWQRKQKHLQQISEEFNVKRLLKYYGWIPLLKVKASKKKQGQFLYQTLLLIVYRVKGTTFINNLEENCEEMLEKQYQQMDQKYRRRLLRKTFSSFASNRAEECENKQDYNIRHQVHLLKIFFTEWKRVHPKIVGENFDWQRPRVKRVEEFHRLQLFHKGFCSLKENKVEQQRNRIIAEQKSKMKSKIRDLLGEGEDINYQQFL